MSSVRDAPGLAGAVAGPFGAAAPAGAAVSTFCNVTGFDRYEFKFRPKRSDFGRKKLRTAETAVGFRLSEVVLSPGRRGGKLGRLQQALRRTPVFYPYRAESQSRANGRGVG